MPRMTVQTSQSLKAVCRIHGRTWNDYGPCRYSIVVRIIITVVLKVATVRRGREDGGQSSVRHGGSRRGWGDGSLVSVAQGGHEGCGCDSDHRAIAEGCLIGVVRSSSP